MTTSHIPVIGVDLVFKDDTLIKRSESELNDIIRLEDKTCYETENNTPVK